MTTRRPHEGILVTTLRVFSFDYLIEHLVVLRRRPAMNRR